MQMTKDEQIAQIKYYTQFMKDRGLNPNIWNKIDELKERLIQEIITSNEDISDSEYNPI